VTYFRHGCGLFDGLCTEIINTANSYGGGGMLMVKHCRVLHDILKLNTEDVSDTLVLLYLTTGVTRNNSVTLIFTVLVTLNCHVVLP